MPWRCCGRGDPYKIKSYKQYKYQIPQLSEQKVREMKLKMLQDNPDAKEYPSGNICFKISYSVNTGK